MAQIIKNLPADWTAFSQFVPLTVGKPGCFSLAFGKQWRIIIWAGVRNRGESSKYCQLPVGQGRAQGKCPSPRGENGNAGFLCPGKQLCLLPKLKGSVPCVNSMNETVGYTQRLSSFHPEVGCCRYADNPKSCHFWDCICAEALSQILTADQYSRPILR